MNALITDAFYAGARGLQNLLDPLPKKQTASNLQEVRKMLESIPSQFDVSVEWIQNRDNIRNREEEGGYYVIHPVRKNEWSNTPLQSPKVVEATKQAMHHEIRLGLVAMAKKLPQGAQFSKDNGNEFQTYSRNMRQAREDNPHAPVNREFLENVFSNHNTDKVPASNPNPNKEKGLPVATMAIKDIRKEPATHEEIKQIVGLLNFIKSELEEKELTQAQLFGEKSPDTYLRKRFDELVAGQNVAFSPKAEELSQKLSAETKKLIQNIRKEQPNWIDESLKNITLLNGDDLVTLIASGSLSKTL